MHAHTATGYAGLAHALPIFQAFHARAQVAAVVWVAEEGAISARLAADADTPLAQQVLCITHAVAVLFARLCAALREDVASVT